MKKKILLLFFVLTAVLFTLPNIFAEETPTASVSGPDILRTEDTLTIVYSVENVQCSGFQGNLSYDKELLMLSDAEIFDNAWNVEVMPNGVFLAYSKTPTNSHNVFKGGQLFSLTFTLKSPAKVGDALKIDFTSVIAATVSADGDSEIGVSDASYRKIIDPPASSDATLSKLGISEMSFSPAFSPEVTEYTIPLGVDFAVESLPLVPVLSHDKASYEIIGNKLSVGNNTVRIKVTAEDGTEMEYSIKVKRAHDPSKPKSDDTRLASLEISCGMLSPAFSPDIRQYAVYLPYGVTSIDVTAVAYNEFASNIPPSTHTLSEGNNIITISCTAEDSSVGQYILNVCVMPEYSGFMPDINNTIPLEGEIVIDGILEVGQTVKAYLENINEDAYSVIWFRQGEKVSEGAMYTFTENDINSVIHAQIIGIGSYSGYFVSEKMYVTRDGVAVDPYDYITAPQKSVNFGLTFICILIASALFLGIGFLIGNAKKQPTDKEKYPSITK